MCGRYVLISTQTLAERFQTQQLEFTFPPRYNAAPSQEMPVVVRQSPNRLELMRWGLIPSWSKEPKPPYSTINARAEGIMDKPTYRGPIRRQRCLVPSNGFFEWQAGDGRVKTPYLIRLRGGGLFAFAGLYDVYHGPDGPEIRSYTIITTEANVVVQPIHGRMPVILHPEDEDEWLDPDVTNPHQVARLLQPYAPELMEAYRVSPLVNSPANDVPATVEPLLSAGDA